MHVSTVPETKPFVFIIFPQLIMHLLVVESQDNVVRQAQFVKEPD